MVPAEGVREHKVREILSRQLLQELGSSDSLAAAAAVFLCLDLAAVGDERHQSDVFVRRSPR